MTIYDDHTTRNTTDGRDIGGMFNWDFSHINNRHSRLISNAKLASTFDEQYDWPPRSQRKLIIGLCLLAVAAFVATFELGAFDGIYLWITN